MPYYDLKCVKCGKEFNKKASIKERTEKSILCPVCGSNDLDPVFKSVNYIRPSKGDTPPCANCCGGSCPLQ
jgi:putative FmdB family regulatory protein